MKRVDNTISGMYILIDCMVGKRRIQIVEDLNYDYGFGDRYELLVNYKFNCSSNSIYELLESYDLPKWLLDDFEKEISKNV